MTLYQQMFGRAKVVGKCWICKAPVYAGKVEFVRDPTGALRSRKPPARKCHRGDCARRARGIITRLAPTLFDA